MIRQASLATAALSRFRVRGWTAGPRALCWAVSSGAGDSGCGGLGVHDLTCETRAGQYDDPLRAHAVTSLIIWPARRWLLCSIPFISDMSRRPAAWATRLALVAVAARRRSRRSTRRTSRRCSASNVRSTGAATDPSAHTARRPLRTAYPSRAARCGRLVPTVFVLVRCIPWSERRIGRRPPTRLVNFRVREPVRRAIRHNGARVADPPEATAEGSRSERNAVAHTGRYPNRRATAVFN